MPAPAVYVLAIVGTVGAVIAFKEVSYILPAAFEGGGRLGHKLWLGRFLNPRAF